MDQRYIQERPRKDQGFVDRNVFQFKQSQQSQQQNQYQNRGQ